MSDVDGDLTGEQEREIEAEGHVYRLRALPSAAEAGWTADVVGYRVLEGAATTVREIVGPEHPTREPGQLLGRMRMLGSSPDEALDRLAGAIRRGLATAVRAEGDAAS